FSRVRLAPDEPPRETTGRLIVPKRGRTAFTPLHRWIGQQAWSSFSFPAAGESKQRKRRAPASHARLDRLRRISLPTFGQSGYSSAMAISHRQYLLVLALLFGLWWIVLAIHPWDRSTWILENALAVLAVALLACFYRRLLFSRVSY